MEITIDIGKNAVEKLRKIAQSDGIDMDIAVLDILDLGLKAYQFSKEKPPEKEVDPLLSTIASKVLASDFMVQEILAHVFERESSLLKTYDAMTAIRVAEQMASAFLNGQSASF